MYEIAILVVILMVLSTLFRACAKILSGYGLGKNRIIVNIYFLLAKKVLPEFITFRGSKIFLDSESSINLANFGYDIEKYELSLFESEINANSIVLDIGSNIGLYTVTAAKRACKVFSFEPDPVSFSNLKKNVEGNMYNNVILVNAAVSNISGQAEFSWSSKRSYRGSNHLIGRFENKIKESITVRSLALDDFFKDKDKRVDIVKIDIEGTEYEAILGMKNLIAVNERIKFFLEFNPYALSRRGTDINQFLDYIYEIRLRTYHIDESEKAVRLVNKEWLLDFSGEKREGRYINLFCVRNPD